MAEIASKHRILCGLDSNDTSEDDVISVYLEKAQNKVVKARYPFGCTDIQREETLEFYSENVDGLLVHYYNKIGADNETAHSDSGTSRTYMKDSDFLDDIVPVADVVL